MYSYRFIQIEYPYINHWFYFPLFVPKNRIKNKNIQSKKWNIVQEIKKVKYLWNTELTTTMTHNKRIEWIKNGIHIFITWPIQIKWNVFGTTLGHVCADVGCGKCCVCADVNIQHFLCFFIAIVVWQVINIPASDQTHYTNNIVVYLNLSSSTHTHACSFILLFFLER